MYHFFLTSIKFPLKRSYLFGGEECPCYSELESIFGNEIEKIDFYNLYGLTEASVWSAIVRVLPGDTSRIRMKYYRNISLYKLFL